MRWLPLLLLWATPAWATVQAGFDGPAAPSTTATNFAGLAGTGGWNATEVNRQAQITIAGKVIQLCATGSADPDNGAGTDSYTLSVRVNAASPTDALSLAFVDGYVANTLQCVKGSTAIAANDLVAIQSVPANTPAAVTFRWYVLFNSTTDGESFLSGGTGASNLSSSLTQYWPIFNRNQPSTTQSDFEFPVATAGTIDTFDCTLSVAPANGGGTQTYTMTLMVNESASADTCAISEAAVSCTADADDVAVVVGDRINVRSVPSGTPAVSKGVCGVRFVATATDEFLLGTGGGNSPSTSATNYIRLSEGGGGWTATESDTTFLMTPMVVSGLAVWLAGTPDNGGGTQSYTVTLRETTADVAPRLTISETDQSGSALIHHPFTLAGLGDLAVTPAGTPTARVTNIGLAVRVPSWWLNAATLNAGALQ